MAFVLAFEIQALAKEFGIERLGFLTLTFADQVEDIREAQRRFHSLQTGVIRGRYKRSIGVWERQRSGRLHFHLVVVLNDDIRTGFDFTAVDRWDYRSASPALRSEWAFWRKTAPRYGFGRTELLPVKSTAEGIAHYVGKYVAKHVANREEADKGARVVRFIGFKPGDRRASTRFGWNNSNAWLWRQKLKAYAAKIGAEDTDAIKVLFGNRWSRILEDEIMSMKVEEAFPDYATAERSSNLSMNRALAASAQDEKPGRAYELRQLPASWTINETDIRLAVARANGAAYTDAFGSITLGFDPAARSDVEEWPVVEKMRLSTETKKDANLQLFIEGMPAFWKH